MQDDYDVVIGVNINDHTAAGAASVRGNIGKMSEDVRKYGDKQAREFGRISKDIFNQTDQHVTRSASSMISRLTSVFETNNFLFRQLARQTVGNVGYVAAGVAKLGLSYNRFGKDTEDSGHKAKVALETIKSAIASLGTDPSAFPAALRATKDLSAAYEGMGKSGQVASVKAGAALEDAVHKRVLNLQTGLVKAQNDFEKLKVVGSKSSEALRDKINDISASARHLLGGANVDAPFFKSFIKARTEQEKYLLVLEKLGPKAAIAYSGNQAAVEKLSSAYVRLESRAAKSLNVQSTGISKAAISVTNYKKELSQLETAVASAAGSTDEAAIATKGFSSAMVATGGVVAIVVAAILAAIAVFAILTIGIYKSSTAAATYGDEIYKLALSTGLTVKTLSTLSVIAKETSTDVDSLAKTFTRTQIQIQRGLDKPFSEAGRALRTLKINFQELRKANPDQQIFTLAKAFTELNNQNVRATVSQQLFSRDAERQSKMLEQIANGFTIAQQKAKKYGLELDESGAVKAHLATVATMDLKLAWEGLWVSLGIKILPQLTSLMEGLVSLILKSGGAFEVFGKIANFVLREFRINIEVLREAKWYELLPPIFPGAMVMHRRKAEGVINQEDKDREIEYAQRIAELKKRGLQGDDQYAAGKGAKSPMDRLEEQVKRIRFEIEALQKVGSKEFKLRFELEELQKVKAGFESIFKLRNEMGLILDEPVPQFRVFGTPEQQRQDLANIESYVKQMDRMKSIFEGVRKVSNEQSDALAELARVQQEALLPVVDAGTLAEIKYQTAIRDRAKSEKDLTASVIAESRLRKDAVQDEVGSTLKAYQTLQRDLGRSQDTIREQRAQDAIFLRIMRGDRETEQGIRQSIQDRMGTINAPVVPTELMTIAAHAATIDLNVAAIAEKIGANARNTSTSTISSPASETSYARSKLVRRNPDGTVTMIYDDDSADAIKSQTTDPGYLRERIITEARQRASGNRTAADRKAVQDILDNQMKLEQTLIDLDTDYLDNYIRMQVARREAARATVISIMLLENDLRDLENTNSQLYKDTWSNADKARLEAHAALKADIIKLQNDIANNGADQSDRERKAHFQAIRDIQEASNQARESMVYNQVKIADATVYHAEIANAKVTEFLANQRSITDVIADYKVAVVDKTFSIIDMALDKITSKMGILGSLVKDLLSGFIRLALSPFFKLLMGGGNGGNSFGSFRNVVQGNFGPNNNSQTSGGSNLLKTLLPGLFGGGGNSASSASMPGSVSNVTSATPWRDWAAKNFPIDAGLAGTKYGSSFGGLGVAFGQMASMLGLTTGAGLGAMAGGQSKAGQILGMLGGAGIGGALGMAAFTAMGGLVSPALAGFMAIAGPAVLIAGPLLIAGAIILAKNKARQMEEKKRNEWGTDAQANILQLLAQARTGDITVAQAKVEWDKIGAAYMAQVNTLKDSKTRRNATLWWEQVSGRVVDPGGKTIAIWPLIEEAARASEGRANDRVRMNPVFASGGISHIDQLIKVRPGEGVKYPGTNVVHTIFGKDLGYDSQYMYAPKGTKILNRQEMATAEPHQHGGTVGESASSEESILHIDSLEVNLDKDGLAEAVIKSRKFKKAVIHNYKLGVKERKIV
jgi:hypothetical protein